MSRCRRKRKGYKMTQIFADNHFISRMKRNCTRLEKKLKFHASLDSELLDTSTTDAYRTGRGGKEMWSANVRTGQTFGVIPPQNPSQE